MRRNSKNKSKRSTSWIRSGSGTKKNNPSNTLIGTFPRSPPGRIKPTEGGAFLSDPTPSTVASGENDSSINNNEPASADQSVAVVSYQSNELLERIDARSANVRTALSPVKEDRSVESSAQSIEAPAKKDKGGGSGGWVGIGFDGEALALSVCSESSSVGMSSLHEQPVPKAIDFKRFESDNLPIVEEDKISVVDDEVFLKNRTAAQRVLRDVEDLSVDLTALEDVESINSVMTKEDAIDLAQRLEQMERQLLELAGETGKVDALRALAKATHNQTKKAESLQRKVRSQEKKISTLNDLCQRLLNRKQQDSALRSTTQKEMDDLRDSNAELTLELHRSELRNEEMSSKLAEKTERIRRMEKEKGKKSKRQLLRSHSERDATDPMQAKLDELREEGRRRAEADRATIRKLESEMTTMAVAHARAEKKSRNKIEILIEMKAAMEEQIRLLEGNDSSTE